MEYKKVYPATFLSRPNRFVARVLFDGKEEVVHVKNTGRCKELLIPGAQVFLSLEKNENRKTRFDLIAVEKVCRGGSLLVNLDSQAPNQVASDYLQSCGLFSPDAVIRREVNFKHSRFDFYIEDQNRRAFVEVKGVTLEQGGAAFFPDAPTQRGVKHIMELIKAKEDGYEAYILFIIQMKPIRYLSPNDVTHPEFGKALREAAEKGVGIFAVDCVVTPSTLIADSQIPVQL